MAPKVGAPCRGTLRAPTQEQSCAPRAFPGAPSAAVGAAREHPEFWGAPSLCHSSASSCRRERAGVGSAGLGGEGMFCTKLCLFIARILVLWGNPQSVPGEQPQTNPSGGVWVFGTSPSQCHCTDTSMLHQLLLCPAGAASASLQPSQAPLACSLVCAKSVQCWLCQVNYFHPCCCCGEPRDQPSSCLHGHTTRAQQGQRTNPSPFQVLWKEGSGAGALSDCRAGILRAGIVFYKKRISKEPPGRGTGDGCRGFL